MIAIQLVNQPIKAEIMGIRYKIIAFVNIRYVNYNSIHDLFFRLREEHGVALVLATHNRELAARTDRVLEVRDAQLMNVSRAE